MSIEAVQGVNTANANDVQGDVRTSEFFEILFIKREIITGDVLHQRFIKIVLFYRS